MNGRLWRVDIYKMFGKEQHHDWVRSSGISFPRSFIKFGFDAFREMIRAISCLSLL
jgi:hypothetical protein